jgi:hypothetical protein
MRVVRNGLVTLGVVATSSVVGALGAPALMASPASAATAPISTQLAIGQVQLGPLGASVSVPLVFTCDPGRNVAFAEVSVTQVSGHRLAQGFGFLENSFPGVPCTGTSETVNMQATASGAFAFKQGKKATATVDMDLFDPVSSNLSTISINGQAIAITK